MSYSIQSQEQQNQQNLILIKKNKNLLIGSCDWDDKCDIKFNRVEKQNNGVHPSTDNDLQNNQRLLQRQATPYYDDDEV